MLTLTEVDTAFWFLTTVKILWSYPPPPPPTHTHTRPTPPGLPSTAHLSLLGGLPPHHHTVISFAPPPPPIHHPTTTPVYAQALKKKILYTSVVALLSTVKEATPIVQELRVPGEIERSRDLRGGRWSWTLTFAQKRS